MEKASSIIQDCLSRGYIIPIEQLLYHFPQKEMAEKVFHWYQNITNQSFLEIILNDFSTCTEVIIHDSQNIQIKFSDKNIVRNFKDFSDLKLIDLQLSYEILALQRKVNWNYKTPFTSFDHHINGRKHRISLLHFSCTAKKVSKIFIRTQFQKKLKLECFLPPQFSELIHSLIHEKRNIIIAGATESGKTTFLQTLLNYCDPTDHIIILEDFNEININHSQISHLIASDINSEHNLESYCKYALRMATDRTVIGEIRSSEVVPLILNMNTGQQAVMATLHANSALDTIPRLSTLFITYASNQLSFENVQQLIASNIDIIIYMKKKKVDHIIEIKGFVNSKPLYNLLYSERMN